MTDSQNISGGATNEANDWSQLRPDAGPAPVSPRELVENHQAKPGVDEMTLRVSVTDRCNLRCKYCMPAAGVPDKIARADMPSLELMADAVQWLHDHFRVTKVKITGGEPLVRQNLVHLIERIGAIEGIREVSMTTNASILDRHADALAAAGMSRLNISLDTLDEERFATVSRGGRLQDTLRGINAAVAAGIQPIKLNGVLLQSYWREDVPALLDYAAENNFEMRFIELMRTGTEAAWNAAEIIPATDVMTWLAEQAGQEALQPVETHASSPARRTLVRWRGQELVVGWITPRFAPFCSHCNRLRPDARGRLKRCLMDNALFPLADSLRDHGSAATLDAAMDYVKAKTIPLSMDTSTSMASIGG